MVAMNAQAAAHAKVQLWEGGPYWATTNIGADKPEDYGLYFWWGDTTGHRPSSDGTFSFNFSAGNSTIYTYGKSVSELQSTGWATSDGVLAPEHDAAHVKWGGTWRMPTLQEFSDLNNNCDWTWATMNGVNGYVVRGRGAYASNSIFLPAAGYGYRTSLSSAGSFGNYWSSVPYHRTMTWFLQFYSGHHHGTSNTSYGPLLGNSIRPIQGFGEEAVYEEAIVSFNANGGTGTMVSQAFEEGNEQKLSKNTYRKDGYVFQGWAVAADGEVVYKDEALITVDSDMTLYAVWANPPLTLAAESADWSSGSITLKCEDADTSGAAHAYSLEYKNESGTWTNVNDSAATSIARDSDGFAHLTDNTFWSRLGGIPPVEYSVKDENGRVSEPCVTRTRHGFAVGLGKYDKSKWGTNPPGGLEQCYNNTDLFAKTMVQDGGIASSNMKFLHNEEATVENITNEWGNIAGKTKPGDVVFFCIATHGASSGALAAYDKLYTVSEFQKNIEPFRSGNRTGVKLVILLLNCHSESMTSKLKDINFEYGSICTANIIYVAVADAEESECTLHRDAEEDVEQGKPRDQKYSEGGEFFLNQGLKKRRADALRTLQGIKGEFGNRDGVVDLLECTRYMDALAIGVSDRSQTNAQYDRNKSEIMRKTAMVKGGVTSDISAPPAPHMTNVAVESGVVNIFVDDVASAQYYKIYYQKVGDNVKHWVASSCSGKISVDDGDAVFRTADVSTHKDRKFFVPLENDATYNFYAVAVNAGGQSPESNVIPISTAPATSLPVYRVFLEAEGGTVSPAYLDVKSGLPVGQLPTPSSKGRSFLGWFTASQGGVEVDPEKLIDMDVKYYAHWSKPTTEIYLPEAWLQCYPSMSFAADGDTTVATYLMSANGCKTVGECYALGIDPEDPDDDFKVTHFEMKDGKPVITLNHTEDGSGNSFMPRVKTLGKADLSDTEWREVPEEGDDKMRFFKVDVEMP